MCLVCGSYMPWGGRCRVGKCLVSVPFLDEGNGLAQVTALDVGRVQFLVAATTYFATKCLVSRPLRNEGNGLA